MKVFRKTSEIFSVSKNEKPNTRKKRNWREDVNINLHIIDNKENNKEKSYLTEVFWLLTPDNLPSFLLTPSPSGFFSAPIGVSVDSSF